ncbi:hypothetical protein GCM10023160_17210 [Brachybacterium paraconglomeratum]
MLGSQHRPDRQILVRDDHPDSLGRGRQERGQYRGDRYRERQHREEAPTAAEDTAPMRQMMAESGEHAWTLGRWLSRWGRWGPTVDDHSMGRNGRDLSTAAQSSAAQSALQALAERELRRA